MNRRLWLTAVVSLSSILLFGVLAAAWLWHEWDAWAPATPQTIARTRTERLLTAAQSTLSGSLPAQFQTEGIDSRCWRFLQSALAAQLSPSISVAANGTPVYRDDDLTVTIRFNDGRTVRLLYLAGGIVECTPDQSQ